VIRVNSQSGKGGISYLLETAYHLELPRRLQIEFSRVVQAVMDDDGKELSAAMIWDIFENEYGLGAGTARIEQATIADSGDGDVTVRADIVSDDGRVTVNGRGNGPLDAFVDGLRIVTDKRVEVLDYHEHAVGGGAQARAAAYLEVRVDGGSPFFGVGIDANIVHASMKAVLSGIMRSDRAHGATGSLIAIAERLAA
jgi:2-isopropylmalate synthase